MAKPLDILVTGATGTQGGAVARQLIKKGHRIRALTRNVASPAAQALAALGVELAQGNLEDRASVDRALTGMEAMFSVATPYEHGPEAETRQSILATDAAAAAGAYLVYSSVANADRHTGVPHFDSKFAVEEHIRAQGIEAAIVAPVAEPSGERHLEHPGSVLEFSSWSHRRRGGIGYEADACTGVWRLTRHCSGTAFGNGGFIPRGMKLGSKRSGRARRFKRLKTNHVVSKLGLSLGPNSLASSSSAPSARPRFFRHGASLGTWLRPDALDRT